MYFSFLNFDLYYLQFGFIGEFVLSFFLPTAFPGSYKCPSFPGIFFFFWSQVPSCDWNNAPHLCSLFALLVSVQVTRAFLIRFSLTFQKFSNAASNCTHQPQKRETSLPLPLQTAVRNSKEWLFQSQSQPSEQLKSAQALGSQGQAVLPRRVVHQMERDTGEEEQTGKRKSRERPF